MIWSPPPPPTPPPSPPSSHLSFPHSPRVAFTSDREFQRRWFRRCLLRLCGLMAALVFFVFCCCFFFCLFFCLFFFLFVCLFFFCFVFFVLFFFFLFFFLFCFFVFCPLRCLIAFYGSWLPLRPSLCCFLCISLVCVKCRSFLFVL